MKVDPSLKLALLKALEKAIAKALQYDPGTLAQLATLHGKVFHIQSTAPEMAFYVQIDHPHIHLLSYIEDPIDCQISGSMANLIRMTLRDQHSLADSGVQVTGDIALLSRLQTLIKQIEIDWESAVNQALGDEVGHIFAQSLRLKFEWLGARSTQFPEWFSEYLSEELRVTPHRLELEDFYNQVQALNTDAERIAAKIRKLAQSINLRPTPNSSSTSDTE